MILMSTDKAKQGKARILQLSVVSFLAELTSYTCLNCPNKSLGNLVS